MHDATVIVGNPIVVSSFHLIEIEFSGSGEEEDWEEKDGERREKSRKMKLR